MKVEFLAKFSKDLDNIHVSSVNASIKRAIIEVENAHTLHEIRNVKNSKARKLPTG